MRIKTIKVSVIIPFYNAEAHISSAIDSVLNQTLKDVEILCFNDGSTDDSLKIVKEMSVIDNRIKIISGKNKGVSWSRNKGIKIAFGEYIAFLDADDTFPNNTQLHNLYETAKNNSAAICGGGMSELRDDGLFREWSCENSGFVFQKDGWLNYSDYQFDYGFYRFIYQSNFLKRKRVFFPNLSRFQDPPFFTKAMVKAERIFCLSADTYLYRVGNQLSWSEKKTEDCVRGIIINIKRSIKYNLFDLYYLSYLRACRDFAKQINDKLEKNNTRVKRIVKNLFRLYDESIITKSKYFSTLGPISIREMVKRIERDK